MLEGVGVVLHVLVVVVGVGEEIVLAAEDVSAGDMPPGEEDVLGVLHLEDLLWVVVEQSSLLVSQVDADVAVTLDAHGAVDAYRAVVGGEHHCGVAVGECFDEFQQWRVLHPRECHRAVGAFVGGQFAHDIALGACVG